MASKKKCDIEGPNEGMFKPGDAASMPTKHYAETTKIATQGKKNTVQGPGEDGMFNKK